ncbi:MAG: hypothetical protein EOO73_35735 [Myxococcales bacterium]|nr:MAG: hypothetical protein EOO73_35735 [Myxococcales bacterium]
MLVDIQGGDDVNAVIVPKLVLSNSSGEETHGAVCCVRTDLEVAHAAVIHGADSNPFKPSLGQIDFASLLDQEEQQAFLT